MAGARPVSKDLRKQLSQDPLGVLMFVLVALTIGGLGVLSILGERSVGTTRGSVTVVTEGAAAVWMGVSQIAFGLLVLTVLIPNRRARLVAALMAGVGVLGGIVMAVVNK